MIKSDMTKSRILLRGLHQKTRNRSCWRKGITVMHTFPVHAHTRYDIQCHQPRFSQLRRLALRKECACVGGKFVSFDELSDYERRIWLES